MGHLENISWVEGGFMGRTKGEYLFREQTGNQKKEMMGNILLGKVKREVTQMFGS